MRTVTWYFDFVSPFAYLQWRRMDELPDDVGVVLRPVLFAGLLAHAGNLGPAEIPAKRVFTYRYVQWAAERAGVPFRVPEAHPFNPLGALRLAIALGSTPVAIGRIFDFIWGEGMTPGESARWTALAGELGVQDVAAVVGAAPVKEALRANTDEAIGRGVFGVPTFMHGELLLWGFDATDMLLESLRDPARFTRGEYARVAGLPVGATRRS